MGMKAIPRVVPGPISSSPEIQVKAGKFRFLLTKWAKRHGRSFPWRRTSDPFKTLIAEMMLQRTRSGQVAGVYRQFVQKYPTIGRLADASPRMVNRILRPLGLNFRARTFQKLARVVSAEHGGVMPVEAEEVVKLPGAGPYSAAAVDAFLRGRRLPVIDANIARVISRVFGIGRPDWRFATARERSDLFEATLLALGRSRPRTFYYGLLDFAAKVCASTPACPDCPMQRARICTHCGNLH
jgi:A/G-specific adenine glycosylase